LAVRGNTISFRHTTKIDWCCFCSFTGALVNHLKPIFVHIINFILKVFVFQNDIYNTIGCLIASHLRIATHLNKRLHSNLSKRVVVRPVTVLGYGIGV
jgi:hypothetical protein